MLDSTWVPTWYIWCWKRDEKVLICWSPQFLLKLSLYFLDCFNILFQESLKLLAINLFNALVSSTVVWFGSNSKWISLVKLHLKRSMYVFFTPTFLLQYMIGPEKTAPITWKGLIPVVLSEGRMSCCCVLHCLVQNLLHPKHFLITLFAICCSLGIQ